MLNRWVDQRKMIESRGPQALGRSRIPSECRNIREGESARAEIIRRISTLIIQVQNASLGEQRIREINDELNRLLRSKFAWEMQIRSLGGPDYTVIGARIGESEGVEIPGQGGYKYFGAAKELPGVRELLDQQPFLETSRKSRKDLLKNIQADYYGWADGDDADLLEEEARMEAEAVSNLDETLKQKRIATQISSGDPAVDIDFNKLLTRFSGSEKDFERILLQRKKELLIAQYIEPSPTNMSPVPAIHELNLKYGAEEEEEKPPIDGTKMDVELVD